MKKITTPASNEAGSKTIRLPFMVSATEAKAIDDWRFNRRVGTRAEAMRKLVQAGIDLPKLCIDLIEALKRDGSIDRSPGVASAANALESYVGTHHASPSETPYRIPGEIRKTQPSSGDDVPPLSERELDVAGLIMDGLPNKTIAQRLELSEGTVKVHIRNIMIKFRANNRGEIREMFPDWVAGRQQILKNR